MDNNFYSGVIRISPALSEDMTNLINSLSETRRVKRNSKKLRRKFKGDHGFRGKYGKEGEFFILKDDSTAIIDESLPPSNQPSQNLCLEVDETGTELSWNGDLDFENPDLWLEYIISLVNEDTDDIYYFNGEIVIPVSCEDDATERELVALDNAVYVVNRDGKDIYPDVNSESDISEEVMEVEEVVEVVEESVEETVVQAVELEDVIEDKFLSTLDFIIKSTDNSEGNFITKDSMVRTLNFVKDSYLKDRA